MLNLLLEDFEEMQPNVKFLFTSKVRMKSFIKDEYQGLELRVEPLDI